MGTNKCASQAGMNAYGTRRHLYDPKVQIQPPMDNTTISLQMGTNKGASQVVQLVINACQDCSGKRQASFTPCPSTFVNWSHV